MSSLGAYRHSYSLDAKYSPSTNARVCLFPPCAESALAAVLLMPLIR
jgi:hypothetical protein